MTRIQRRAIIKNFLEFGFVHQDRLSRFRRAGIERAAAKHKCFKRIALLSATTAGNDASFVALVRGFILIKSVHIAQGPRSGKIPLAPQIPNISFSARCEVAIAVE